MKNTLKNKAKFFAQYWGQEICKAPFNDNLLKPIAVINYAGSIIRNSYLELKPLSSISDDDAMKLIQIVCGTQYIEPNIINIKRKKTSRKYLYIDAIEWSCFEVIKHETDKPIKMLLHISSWGSINVYINSKNYHTCLGNNSYQSDVVDEIRDMGYAYKFKKLTVEQQIEFGWIKLKNNE